MPGPDFDPMDGLSEEDKSYIDSHKTAFQRQAAAHASDEARKKAAREHMKSTQEAAGVPVRSHEVDVTPSGEPAPVRVISIMVAKPDEGDGLPSTTEKFAPDWNSMKDIIAKYDGTWIVSRHQFPEQVSDILGFFRKDGWPPPEDSEAQRFEVIVKNGRVFRTDPE